MFEHAHLVRKPRGRVRSVIRLEHAPIKTQMDGGTERVFDLQHVLLLHSAGKIRQENFRCRWLGKFCQLKNSLSSPAKTDYA